MKRKAELYAASLRNKALLLRTDLLVSATVRRSIANDLDALAGIAETNPEAFAHMGEAAKLSLLGQNCHISKTDT